MNRWLAIIPVVGIVVAFGATGLLGDPRMWGVDAWSYWSYDQVHPYVPGVWGGYGAYQYSPAFAQVFMLGQLVPWQAFLLVWTTAAAAALVWLTGWLAVPIALVPAVTREVWYGNVHLLLAVALVAGFKHPWTWAFVLLTKVTPGICLLWFVARRDWRSLRIALGATAAVVVISWVLAPWMWSEWISLLVGLARESHRPPRHCRSGLCGFDCRWPRRLHWVLAGGDAGGHSRSRWSSRCRRSGSPASRYSWRSSPSCGWTAPPRCRRCGRAGQS